MSGWDVIRDVLLAGSPQTSAEDRIRSDSGNEGDVYPLVVGHRVVVERDFGLDNTLLAHKETYQLECWGEDRVQASTLEDEVVTLLIQAGLPPDPAGPDGLDPTVDVRASLVYVSLWLDIPEIL